MHRIGPGAARDTSAQRSRLSSMAESARQLCGEADGARRGRQTTLSALRAAKTQLRATIFSGHSSSRVPTRAKSYIIFRPEPNFRMKLVPKKVTKRQLLVGSMKVIERLLQVNGWFTLLRRHKP